MDIGENYSHLYTNNTKKKRKINTDGLTIKNIQKFSHIVSQDTINDCHQKNTSALLLNGERTSFFVTSDFLQQLTCAEQSQDQHIVFVDARGRFDSIHPRHRDHFVIGQMKDHRLELFVARSQDVISDYRAALRITMTPMRMYQVSLTGAMVVGMVSMNFIYRNLGQSAFAQEVDGRMIDAGSEKEIVRVIENDSNKNTSAIKDVAKEDDNKKNKEEDISKERVVALEDKSTQVTEKLDIDPVIVTDIVKKDDVAKSNEKSESEKRSVDSVIKKDEKSKDDAKALEDAARETVEGYPIEKMLPYILEQDPEVAKYLIAIAKQESQWGKRVPVLNGQDCYNYWGYRGQRKLMGTGGHTCFNSREDAVKTVGKRLHTLIYENDRKTANKLVVWKCGSSCSGHSQDGVDRWINVVKTYYDKLSQG